MPDREEYLRRGLEAEREAFKLPPGYSRDELLRRASAFYDIAETLRRAEEEREQAKPRREEPE